MNHELQRAVHGICHQLFYINTVHSHIYSQSIQSTITVGLGLRSGGLYKHNANLQYVYRRQTLIASVRLFKVKVSQLKSHEII